MVNKSKLIEEINERMGYCRNEHSKEDTENFCFEAYLNDTIKMAQSIKYQEGIYCGQLLSVKRDISYCRYKEAYKKLKDFEKQVIIDELSPENKMKYFSAYCLYYMGFSGDREKAIKYSKLEMLEAEKVGDMEEIMRVKMNIASLSSDLGFSDTSEVFFAEVIKYYESTKNLRVLTYCYLNAGLLYLRINNHERAKELYKKAYELARQIKERVISTTAAIELAGIIIEEGNIKEALEILYVTLHVEEKFGNFQREFEIIQTVIEAYSIDNRYEEALGEINKFEVKIGKIENKLLTANFYKLKAKICKKLNKIDEAYTSLEKYISLYKEDNIQESEHAINELIHEEYNKTIKRLESIAKVGRELTLLTSTDQILLDMKKELSKVLEVHSIGIGKVVDNKISYTNFFNHNKKVYIGSKSLDDKKSLATFCIKNREIIVINDFEKEHSKYIDKIDSEIFESKDNDRSISSLLYAPLMESDKVFGVFTVQSENKGAYTSIEVNMFTIIAEYVAIAVRNADQKLALEQLSVRDNLTNMYNRRGFTEFFDKKVMKSDCEYNSIAIIMLDLDHFKKVNDTYGHGAGDLVLSRVGKVLMGKEADNIRAARLGGEEFALVIFDEKEKFVEELANSIRKDIEKLRIFVNEIEIKVTTSIGLTYRGCNKDINYNQLYFEADKALYKAKSSGRNKVQVYCN